MARPHRYRQIEVAEAVRASRGLVTLAARRLGCDRKTVLRYADRYPNVAEALEEARELQLDVSEARLFQAIEQGESWAIQFHLRTVGRHRGYSERHEVAVDGKLAVEAEAAELRLVLLTALQPFPLAREAAAAALLALDAPRPAGENVASSNVFPAPPAHCNGHRPNGDGDAHARG